MKEITMRKIKNTVEIIVILLFFLALFFAGRYLWNTHFLWGTEINGVFCSFLNIDNAIEKINLEKGEEVLTFKFIDGKTYTATAKELGIRVDEAHIVRIFNDQHQNPRETRTYETYGFFLADENVLKNFLKQIPELQEENMINPQDAYMVWDETVFSIQEEVYGNKINFEEAMDMVLENIKNGTVETDFSSITDINPNVVTEDFIDETNELNSILSSSINFELSDGSSMTLDSNIIKNWVYQDENGKFIIDIENGVVQFVEELANKANAANSIMHFKPSDLQELATVNVPVAVRAQLDKEREIAEIYDLLGNSESISKEPIYNRTLVSNMLTSYIEIDLTRQHIWFYLNGTLILDTDCVTGCVSSNHSTPTGVFFLLNKNRGVYLEGYNNDGSKYSSYVEYWMRFNQGIGMHDATWRSRFGGTIYKNSGSHGCVNMPFKAAAELYEYIDSTMPIIVYQS